ncbi:ClpP/crotonase-like domain-containing protein [Aspergillus pseudodeflectus]|uniref:ClpP/crotonase-like domain-containing protein n=1 Tax=Aspergillus pseudodeflectus TaxID=176178 RepID=A0ABR4KYV0_9EURO
MPQFATPPPQSSIFTLSFPKEHILLVTINRERRMNAIPTQGHRDGFAIWNWFDEEPSLRVGIITGAGSKAFSAGADLLEQLEFRNAADERKEGGSGDGNGQVGRGPMPNGFGGISQRRGKKPVIAAVNGLALGGGFEICLNCDMIVSSPTAQFALPEALRGLYAGAGGLSRIVRTVGMPIASELALTGRRITAQEAKSLRLINHISESPEKVLSDAIELAQRVADVSPDAVIVSRYGLRESWETGNVEAASRRVAELYGMKLISGENLKRGLEAFAMKQKPVWVDSKL